MLEKYLKDLGLSDKEASVYLILLQVDSMTVLEMSKKTKINRTTIYPVIESLEKKGLVSGVVNKKNEYMAESPERLETYVDRQKILLEENANKLKDIIPQLKSIQREMGERPLIQYYEGMEGIINVTKGTFANADKNPGEMAYMIYPKDILNEILAANDFSKMRGSRVANKVKAMSIYTYEKGEIPSDDTLTGTPKLRHFLHQD